MEFSAAGKAAWGTVCFSGWGVSEGCFIEPASAPFIWFSLSMALSLFRGDIVRIKAEVSKVPDLSLFIS